MAAQPGDGKYYILWKLVESVGGVPKPGDSLRDLLAKYLTDIGGTPVQGDHFHDLLVKVVIIKGGTPTPGDKEWDLLVKWLQAEGQCRACGDSVHDLWKKILALPALPEGPVLLAPEAESLRVEDPGDHLNVHYIVIQTSDDGVSGWTNGFEYPVDQVPLNLSVGGAGGKFARAAYTIGDAVPLTQWSNPIFVLPQVPLFSWVGPQTFFVSPTLAGGVLEVQHGPDVGGPFTAFLTGIDTPGADHVLDFTGEGEPGGLWYRGRVSFDGVNWSDWGTPAWDDNS
jgi:hypothetical protein